MKKYVLSHLTKHYEIDTSQLGNDGIYEKSDTREYRAPIDNYHLLKRLNQIFGLSKEYLKELVNEWAKTIKNDIDLEFFWSDLVDFSVVRKVIPELISSQLVAVHPMEMPSNFTLFNNFKFSSDTPNRNGRIYSDEIRMNFNLSYREYGR
jgi:hypothetical protein